TAAPTPKRSASRCLVDGELARRGREIATAVGGDHEHVLETDAADRGVIDPRFDGHDLPGDQRLDAALRDLRHFVDLEAHAMARPVDEAAGRAVIRILLLPRPEGVVAGAPDDVLDDRVHLAAGHSWPEGANAGVL